MINRRHHYCALIFGMIISILVSSVAALSERSAAAIVLVAICSMLLGYSSLILSIKWTVRQLISKHNDKFKAISNRVVQAVEKDRGRISRELHDSVGQALYSVLVGVKIVRQLKIDESIRGHFEQVEMLTSRAMEEVKRMAYELRPAELDDWGLASAIRAYLTRYEYTYDIHTMFKINEEDKRYHQDIEISLYRICQEALTNTAKYASTKQVDINIQDDGKQIRMLVRDYGKGFAIHEYDHSSTKGMGLLSIRERAALVGGQVMIHSIPGHGTTIEVQVPL